MMELKKKRTLRRRHQTDVVVVGREIGSQAGKIDNETATLRSQNANMASSSTVEREVLVEYYPSLETPKRNAK